ncbi:hypothetical protein TSUD_34990 [Trifolium subterraneum]|uniref:Reverse transcriptase zinc-binding domain-containing protein n=1 Tax=Trifolium subterraneum TaxID=3900 RepID=A0A2Z6LS49_TRISU|nr:hypothetical protein TSUD_34990 [Trifolium subterraneum]
MHMHNYNVAVEGLHVLMEAMVERNLFIGYSVGEVDPVPISHLQFADDTLLLEVKSWANVRALRAVLVLFEAMSGLKSVGSSLRGGGMESERGRRRGSSWWREIVHIRDTGGGLWGGWFGEHISIKVGDGSDTFFWTDPWAAETPLCERFGHLFDLAEAKSPTVVEMFALGWGTGGEAWVWRRPLRGWEEEELRECQNLLSTISLQALSLERWHWQLDPVTDDSVRGAYHLLTSQDSVTRDDAAGLIWHTQVPLKVSIFAWHLLRDRLPTKSNLVSCGILSLEAHHCVSGCGMVEFTQHLFLSYSSFGSLWSLVSSWIDSTLVDSQTLSDHFMQFTFSAGVSRARRSFMQLIWWLKATSSTLALNYHSWWSSHLVYLSFV